MLRELFVGVPAQQLAAADGVLEEEKAKSAAQLSAAEISDL